jgi:hypothetical protein
MQNSHLRRQRMPAVQEYVRIRTGELDGMSIRAICRAYHHSHHQPVVRQHWTLSLARPRALATKGWWDRFRRFRHESWASWRSEALKLNSILCYCTGCSVQEHCA